MSNTHEDNPPGAVLLSAKQVALMLQVSTRTLWRLVDAGNLISPIRLGHSVRWRKEEILSWISAGCPACLKPKEKE